MATIFSETLTRLRKEAGYATAYRFFHDNGGAPVFKVSYRNYLMMEQGRNLPVLGRLEKIVVGLHMPFGTPAVRELTKAWLKTMAGEEPYTDLLEPLFNGASPVRGVSPAEAALGRTLAEKKYHITMAQVIATVGSFEAYKCFFVLETDTGVWTAEDLAMAVGIKKAAAGRALKDFLKAGLVKAEGEGYRCKIAGRLVEYPASPAFPKAVIDTLREFRGKLEREGRPEFSVSGMVRADADALRGFYPMLKSSVEASYAFATATKTKRSAGYFISAKVHKLWDF